MALLAVHGTFQAVSEGFNLNDTMNNWKPIGVSVNSRFFSINGINVWGSKWHRLGTELVDLPHPSYPNQMHWMHVYQIASGNNIITFAAGELSANVWGFYEAHDARHFLKSNLGSRILKVNHAGENGAIKIYQGQLLVARLFSKDLVEELIECKSHEERHLKIFEAELSNRRQLRCKSFHICGIGGFFLGVITGLCGRNAIAATAKTVESVVLKHLSEQIMVLQDVDESAVNAIKGIIADEQAHHDQFSAKLNPSSMWLKILSPVVALSTEAVIGLGMKL